MRFCFYSCVHGILCQIKGIFLSKALTCIKIFLYKQELLFCQEDGYLWPHCCMNNLYISHRSLYDNYRITIFRSPGRVAQSVTCLATDACLTAYPGVASSIPVRSHTFVEIDHEMISTVILLRSADSFKKGCCQLQAKVCARITG